MSLLCETSGCSEELCSSGLVLKGVGHDSTSAENNSVYESSSDSSDSEGGDGIDCESDADFCNDRVSHKSDLNIKEEHNSGSKNSCLINDTSNLSTNRRDCYKRIPLIQRNSHSEEPILQKADIKQENSTNDYEKFNCRLCDSTFIASESLNCHFQLVHMKEASVSCPLCDSCFSHSSDVSTHISFVHKHDKSYECSFCHLKFRHCREINLHWRSVHCEGKPHGCNECGSTFTTEKDLADHTRSLHNVIKQFFCSECDYKSCTRKSLKQHWAAAHCNQESCVCSECSKQFSNKNYLKRHMNKFHFALKPNLKSASKSKGSIGLSSISMSACQATDLNEGSMGRSRDAVTDVPYSSAKLAHYSQKSCVYTQCSKGFSNVKRHMKKFHLKLKPSLKWISSSKGTIGSGQARDSNQGPVDCSRDFLTVAQQDLTKFIHYKWKSFVCTDCGKGFSNMNYLKRHMNRFHLKLAHYNEKSFVCTECGKAFSDANHMKRHVGTVHTDTKLFPCSFCDKMFSQISNLRTHIKTIHKRQKLFTCKACGKSFSQKGNLQTHVSTIHVGERNYVCKVCGHTFAQLGNLQTHLKVAHDDAKPYECFECDQKFAINKDMRNHMYSVHRTK